MKTLLKIQDDLSDFVQQHAELRSFAFDEPLKAVNSNTLQYPALVAFVGTTPTFIRLSGVQYSIDFLLLDRLRKDETNKVYLLNTLQLITNEMLIFMRSKGWGVDDLSITPVIDGYKDELCGWQGSIMLRGGQFSANCNMPI
jgi:hypothetical protein